MKVCPICPICPDSKCYSVSWRERQEGFHLFFTSLWMYFERRPGVTAWSLNWAASAHRKSPNDARCSGGQIPAPIGIYHQRQMDGAAPRVHVRLVMFQLSIDWRIIPHIFFQKRPVEIRGVLLWGKARKNMNKVVKWTKIYIGRKTMQKIDGQELIN